MTLITLKDSDVILEILPIHLTHNILRGLSQNCVDTWCFSINGRNRMMKLVSQRVKLFALRLFINV